MLVVVIPKHAVLTKNTTSIIGRLLILEYTVRRSSTTRVIKAALCARRDPTGRTMFRDEFRKTLTYDVAKNPQEQSVLHAVVLQSEDRVDVTGHTYFRGKS